MRDVKLSSINLNLMVAFEALLEEKNVSRAAEKIGVTQPALSHSLRQLRLVFNDPLFVRAQRGMEPTPRARELATYIIPGLAKLRDALNDRVNFDPTSAHRHFTLGLSDIGSFEVLPLLMPVLRRDAPNISLTIVDLPAASSVAKLHLGEIDLALNAFPEIPTDLLSHPLSRLAVVCIVDRNNRALKKGKLDLEAFLSLPHVAIGSSQGNIIPPDFELSAMGLRRQVVLHVPHFLAIPGAVVGTDLVAVFDAHAAEAFSGWPELLMVEPPVALSPPSVLMVWHPKNNDDAGHAWLRAQIIDLHRNIDLAETHSPRLTRPPGRPRRPT